MFGNPFQTINLIGNSLYVAHSNIISKYSVLKQEWSAHMMFPNKQISKVVRTSNTKEKQFDKENPKTAQDLTVLTNDNSVYRYVIS